MSSSSEMGKVRVAAYCRVSTEKEDQINSLETQRTFFDSYINQRPDWSLVNVFADEGLSGTSMSRRPEFRRMIDLAKAGEIDLIITKEVSRFARNTVDTLTVTRELKTLGVGVIFLNDGIDTRDNDGEFRLTIMASVAQEESRKISERTRWGQAQAMKRGVVFGNDSIYGYNLRNGQLTVDPEQAEVVRIIYHDFLTERKGTYSIARELTEAGIDPPMRPGGVWSSTAVLRILRNEKYTGDLLQQKFHTLDYLSHRKVPNPGEVPQILLRDHHEAIISREMFDQAQEELARRHALLGDKKRFSARHWYSGKVVCGDCGSTFTVKRTRRNGKEYARLICRGSTSARCGGTCRMRGVSLRMLETSARYVLAQLSLDREAMVKELLDDLQALRQNGSGTAQDEEKIRQAIHRQTARRDRALEAYLDGTISKEDWTRQAQKCDAELTRLNAQLAEWETLVASLELSREKYDTIRTLLKDELNGGPSVLEEVIEKIVVQRDSFVITVRDLPVSFNVEAQGVGSGPSYRVEVTACKAIPL